MTLNSSLSECSLPCLEMLSSDPPSNSPSSSWASSEMPHLIGTRNPSSSLSVKEHMLPGSVWGHGVKSVRGLRIPTSSAGLPAVSSLWQRAQPCPQGWLYTQQRGNIAKEYSFSHVRVPSMSHHFLGACSMFLMAGGLYHRADLGEGEFTETSRAIQDVIGNKQDVHSMALKMRIVLTHTLTKDLTSDG